MLTTLPPINVIATALVVEGPAERDLRLYRFVFIFLFVGHTILVCNQSLLGCDGQCQPPTPA